MKIGIKYMYMHVHSNTIYKGQMIQLAQISIDGEWVNKLWHLHTIEYYSVIKKSTDTCYNVVNLENILISERSQTQKVTLYDSIYIKYPE